MPGDDLKTHATSTSHDFYELLGVNFETSESDIRRAYRRTALKYHPDKNGGNPEALEKFHLLQIAYDVLSDPAIKALYDNTRRAKKEKDERDAAFQGKRRKMKEDLERRESGFFKRKREEDEEEEKLEREIKRLAEDGRRRREARQEMLKRERDEEAAEVDRVERETSAAVTPKGGTAVPEMDRAVKARWLREGAGENIGKEDLVRLFGKFGKVESAILLKDKRKKIEEHKPKTVVATGVIVFASVVGAYSAIEDISRQQEEEYRAFESVFWASDKEPDFLQPKVPISTPVARPQESPGIRKVPSFASFSPKASPFGKASAQSASLEEMTMIRLKMAEKRRLEAEIRKQEAAE